MSLVMPEPKKLTPREACAIEHHRAARSLIRPVLLFAGALLVAVGGFLYLIGA